VGLTTDAEDIDGVDILPNSTIVISTLGTANVPGVSGGVDDSDLLRFIPTHLGSVTTGSWAYYFDGSDVGLSTDVEDLDGVGIRTGQMVFSTRGSMSVPGLTAANEDASVFHPTRRGRTTRGVWVGIVFDGSDFGLGTNNVSAVEAP
jgi:hypothetical protein